MSNTGLEATGAAITLRTLPVPWKGTLLLACRKCQKKLRRSAPTSEAANLKKALKLRRNGDAPRVRVLQVPCLKLCPKGAVTVCTQPQLAHGLCSIVRNSADLDALSSQCRSQPTLPQASAASP